MSKLLVRFRSAILGAALLSVTAACGSTEPTLSDGEFRASMTGSFERSLAGTAGFSVTQSLFPRIVLELTDPFSGPTADGEQWGVFFSLPQGAVPAPNKVFALSQVDMAVFLIERRRTNGTVDGYSWDTTAGEVRFDSVAKGLYSGTFSVTGRRTYGTETVTITGSFRALCPATGALPGTLCE